MKGSGNALRESISEEPNEMILAAFRDVGLILAEARKEQNLTIKQVADKIYIRQRYLEDLEVGDFSDLPGRAYILGFIRTYARLLNLDGEELVRRVSTLPNLPNYQRDQSPIPMHSEEEPNFTILIVSVALIFLIAIGGYFFLKPTTKVSAPIINETIIGDSKVQPPQESKLNSFSEEDASEAERLQLPKEAPSQIQLNSIPSNDKSSTEAPAESITEETPAESITKEEIPNASFQKKITLKASEPSWIEIRDEAGRILFMKVLKGGEEYVVPEKPGITLNTGNAGGLDIFIGDTKLPSLGAHGDVKRGIRLETLQ